MSKTFTIEEISKHNTRDDLWIIYEGKVYDCSEYLDEHPGGEEVIVDCGGIDATEPFDDIGHSDDAKEILQGLLIGEVEGGAAAVKSSQSSSSTAVSGSSSSTLPLIAAAGLAIAVGAFFALRK